MHHHSGIPAATDSTRAAACRRMPSPSVRYRRKMIAETVRTRAAEAALEQLVRGVDLAAEVGGDEEGGDQEPPDDVADHELQERPVAAVGRAGRADEGERARLGGHDAGGDGPPRHAARGQEVVAHGLAAAAQPGAEGGDGHHVGHQHDQGGEGKLHARAARWRWDHASCARSACGTRPASRRTRRAMRRLRDWLARASSGGGTSARVSRCSLSSSVRSRLRSPGREPLERVRAQEDEALGDLVRHGGGAAAHEVGHFHDYRGTAPATMALRRLPRPAARR